MAGRADNTMDEHSKWFSVLADAIVCELNRCWMQTEKGGKLLIVEKRDPRSTVDHPAPLIREPSKHKQLHADKKVTVFKFNGTPKVCSHHMRTARNRLLLLMKSLIARCVCVCVCVCAHRASHCSNSGASIPRSRSSNCCPVCSATVSTHFLCQRSSATSLPFSSADRSESRRRRPCRRRDSAAGRSWRRIRSSFICRLSSVAVIKSRCATGSNGWRQSFSNERRQARAWFWLER